MADGRWKQLWRKLLLIKSVRMLVVHKHAWGESCDPGYIFHHSFLCLSVYIELKYSTILDCTLQHRMCVLQATFSATTRTVTPTTRLRWTGRLTRPSIRKTSRNALATCQNGVASTFQGLHKNMATGWVMRGACPLCIFLPGSLSRRRVCGSWPQAQGMRCQVF